jgi:peptidyl-prolyl cis-trans isomerase SDCCAG10
MNLPTSAKEEPPTSAKAVLFTSHGEIEIEMWAREAPLACKNFIQHCFNDYYKDTLFHRLIPGFMIQGGDPTGTGTGGESIYGFPFKDEFHQRLRFTRRGIVAMANSGKDANGSQFFITFGDCEHLYKKHTIFGKVVGDTIFNLMAMQSLDTDSEDRPVDPPIIRRTKVILNPFDDIRIAARQE